MYRHEAHAIATERGARRDQTSHGPAAVAAEDAEADGRTAEATPNDMNQHHPEVGLPLQATHEGGATWHAKQLAKTAKWLPRGELCMNDPVVTAQRIVTPTFAGRMHAEPTGERSGPGR